MQHSHCLPLPKGAGRSMAKTAKRTRLIFTLGLTIAFFVLGLRCAEAEGLANQRQTDLASEIRADQTLGEVHRMAQDVLKSSLTAGNGYGEVWIRDLNTSIEVAWEVNPPARLREALLTFLKFQGTKGDIVDGY